MGTLEIRRSTATLKTPSSLRMSELDTGRAAAMSARSRAALAAASAAQTIGHARISSTMARGRALAGAFNSLGGVAMEIAERENRRAADLAIVEMEAWRDAEMNGDGTDEHPGRFHEAIDDPRAWLESVNADADRKKEEILSGLSGGARGMFADRYARDELKWRGRINSHAAKATLDGEIAASDGLVALRMKEAADSFGDAAQRDAAIAEYFAQVESNCEAKFIPSKVRPHIYRKAAFDLVSAASKATVAKWEAAAAESSDPVAVAKDFDEAIAKARASGGEVLDNAQLKAAIGSGGLTKAEGELLMSHLVEARNRAVSAAYSRRERIWNDGRLDAISRERAMFEKQPTSPSPAANGAFYRELADGYAELSRRADLSPAAALAYSKTALVMRQHAERELAGDRKLSASLKRTYDAATSTTHAQMLNAAITAQMDIGEDGSLSRRTDSMGRGRPWTSAEISDAAQRYLADERISPEEYAALIARGEKAHDAEGQAFVDKAMASIMPAAPAKAIEYDAAFNAVNAVPAGQGKNAVTPESKTPVKFRGREAVLYRQAAEALDLTFIWMQRYNKTSDEGIAHFNEMMQGNVETYNRETIADTISAAASALRGRPPPAEAPQRTDYATPTPSGLFLPF